MQNFINEQFIYIGTMPTKKETEENDDNLFNTYFFFHYERDIIILKDEDIIKMSSEATDIKREFTGILEMSTQVYNLMIKEMMISKNDKIVIFNLLRNAEIVIVVVDHINFERVYYEEDLLKQYFISMMNNESITDIMVIAYNGEGYLLYEMDFSFTDENRLSLNDIKDKNTYIYECLTTLPIGYL